MATSKASQLKKRKTIQCDAYDRPHEHTCQRKKCETYHRCKDPGNYVLRQYAQGIEIGINLIPSCRIPVVTNLCRMHARWAAQYEENYESEYANGVKLQILLNTVSNKLVSYRNQ